MYCRAFTPITKKASRSPSLSDSCIYHCCRAFSELHKIVLVSSIVKLPMLTLVEQNNITLKKKVTILNSPAGQGANRGTCQKQLVDSRSRQRRQPLWRLWSAAGSCQCLMCTRSQRTLNSSSERCHCTTS